MLAQEGAGNAALSGHATKPGLPHRQEARGLGSGVQEAGPSRVVSLCRRGFG